MDTQTDASESGLPSTRRKAMRIMLVIVGMGAVATASTLAVLWSSTTAA